MPHVIVEYSANLRDDVAASRLLAGLGDALLAQRDGSGGLVFPIGGLRVRAMAYNEYVVADGSDAPGFVHVTLKIGSGRPEVLERAVADAAFATLVCRMADALRSRPLSLSLDLQRLPEALSLKHNTIHAYLRDRPPAIETTEG